MAKSSGLDKAHGLKKKKASSELENEIKQSTAESSRLDKAQGLKKKNELQVQKGNKKGKG